MEDLGILPQMRALVGAVHQLADAGRGGGDDARRQAGGEDIRAADQPQHFEFRVVGDAEPANRAHALGECTNDEVNVIYHILRLGDAAAVFTDEAHRMRFVDQHHRTVFLGDADHFLQRGDIAQHGVDTFQHNQLARAFGDALQALFHRLDVVVFERHHFGVAHLAAIIDRGMAVDVEDDVVALAGDGGDDPQIGLVAGGEHHRVVHRVEFAQCVFDLAVALIGAVEHAAARSAAAELLERPLARLDHIGIEGHAHIIVGAQQDRLTPVADRLRRREHLFHDQAERVFVARGKQVRPLLDQRIEFRKQVGPVTVHDRRPFGLADAFAHPRPIRPLAGKPRRPAGHRFQSRPVDSC